MQITFLKSQSGDNKYHCKNQGRVFYFDKYVVNFLNFIVLSRNRARHGKINHCILDHGARKLLLTTLYVRLEYRNKEKYQICSFGTEHYVDHVHLCMKLVNMHLKSVWRHVGKMKIIINYFIFLDLFNQFWWVFALSRIALWIVWSIVSCLTCCKSLLAIGWVLDNLFNSHSFPF